MTKILFDITVFKAGFSGIPQDARRIFNILNDEGRFKLDAIIFPDSKAGTAFKTSARKDLNTLYKKSIAKSQIYGFKKPIFHRIKFFNRLNDLLGFLLIFFTLFKRVSIRTSLPVQELKRFLEKYFEVDDEIIETEKNFTKIKFANISSKFIHIFGTLGLKIRIDTRGYDFYFSPMPCPIIVSPNTQLVVRYHDAIPITHPDLINTPESIIYTYNVLKNCVKQDAIFVCNSESSELELKELFPNKNLKCLTIPCSVPETEKPNRTINYYEIFQCLSSNHANEEQHKLEFIKSFLEKPYLISIGNLEPKKNQVRLLRAIRKLNSDGLNVNLVLIGNEGWKSESVKQELSLATNLGIVLHLQNVPRRILNNLIFRSSAYIFPSLIEGFGMGIAEAMANKKLVLCSDIPAHRYVTDNNALFFNPLSVASMISAIERADKLITQDGDRKIVENAFIRSQLYSTRNTKLLWHDLFLQTKKKHQI